MIHEYNKFDACPTSDSMSIVPDAMFFLITMQLPTRAMVLVAFIDSGTKNLSEEVSVLEVPIRSPGMVVKIEASCAASAPDKPCKFSACTLKV